MTPEHETLLERIGSAAAAVRRATNAVPAGRENVVPAEGEWSVRETLIHLRAAVMLAYGVRIRRLLYEDEPAFADFDEQRHRRAALARNEPIRELAAAVVAEHEQIVRLLGGLPDADWARQGRHPTYGILSIELLARRVAEHAEEHAAQIAAAAERPG
jgi:hypothetical protein